MIQFSCLCGEKMEVPAELAGEMLQCPVCMRLLDVPRLTDIPVFEDDGTLRFTDAPEPTPSDLGNKFRAFGGHVDMRPTYEELQSSGTGVNALPTPRSAPRYDPITGELMLPIEIADDPLPPPPPPLAAGAPVLGYSRAVTPELAGRPNVPWWSMPWRLMTGWSLMAGLVIWAVHAVAVVGLTLPGLNVFFIVYAVIFTLIIIAHYANTLEDFGPNDRDRVPVLLRSVSMGEDIWSPLASVLIATLYSFGPLILGTLFAARSIYRIYPGIGFALAAWGVLLFPVAAFTLICGGSWQNLAPKRMLSVIVAAPGRFTLASLTFYVACAAYVYAMSLIQFAPPTSLVPSATRSQLLQQLFEMLKTMGIFMAPVYLMHLSMAWLGLIYRLKADDFNWVFQRHERTYRDDTIARLMKRPGPKTTITPPPAAPQRLGFEVKV